MKGRLLFVQFVFVSTLLLILAGICSLSAAEDQESQAPPEHVYTNDQLNVIQKHGTPWQFNIVFEQNAKFRYETWYYGGNIKKKFGFVNGKQELEAAFKFPLSDVDRVVGFEPKNFTFGTKAKDIRVMFGAPDKIFRTSVPGIKQESHTYARKGVAASFVQRKIDGVATIPPFKNSAAGKMINAAMSLSEMTLSDEDFGISSDRIQESGPPVKFTAIEAAQALLLAGLLIAEAVELSGQVDIKIVENNWATARALILLAIDVPFTANDLKQAISEFKNSLKKAACPTGSLLDLSASNCDPSLDYVNNLGDIQSTMGKTAARSDEFPVTVINYTHLTGSECGAVPIPLSISLDGRSLGQLGAGRSVTKPLTRGSHSAQACGESPFGCFTFDFKVPNFTSVYFFWSCPGARGIPVGVTSMN